MMSVKKINLSMFCGLSHMLNERQKRNNNVIAQLYTTSSFNKIENRKCLHLQ